MDERINIFIEELSKALLGLPENEAGEALSYYREYLSDAEEAGKDLGEVIKSLGTPEKIAAGLKAEASMQKALKNPGLKSLADVLKNVTAYVTAPFAILLVACFAALSFSVVAVLFACAAVVLAGAAAVLSAMIFEAFRIHSRYTAEIIGTLGFGIFGSGLLFLISYGLYILARLSVKATLKALRLFIRKPANESGEPAADTVPQSGAAVRKKRPGRIAAAAMILSFAGLAAFGVSGMPAELFRIFNSIKPQNITMRTAEFQPENIGRISVVTAHSHIILKRNQEGKIKVTYEQPDWLDYDLGLHGNTLSFTEKSAGKYPLFGIMSLHESRTEVTVYIPRGVSPEAIDLKTTGGHIDTGGLSENITARANTGTILIDLRNAESPFNIKAFSEGGSISVNGTPSGSKTAGGAEYYRSAHAAKTIDAHTSGGSVDITAD